MGDGVAAPRRLMKSSAVLASEVISRAAMRLSGVVAAVGVLSATPGCGVKVTMSRQLAEGSSVAQLLWREKSGDAARFLMWMGTVPVLARVTVWAAEALPTCVEAKVRELAEAV